MNYLEKKEIEMKLMGYLLHYDQTKIICVELDNQIEAKLAIQNRTPEFIQFDMETLSS